MHTPPPENPFFERSAHQHGNNDSQQDHPPGAGAEQQQHSQPHTSMQPEAPADPAKPKDTTLLQDILGGVGLDDDRILILGLILILINDKADTTLILALLYLLL